MAAVIKNGLIDREIKKMQRLSSNILTTWHEMDDTDRMIEIKSDI